MVLWLKYEPQELVDTSNLSSEEWLSYRRRGIGGSDAAAILGISPWRTARDLYYDKLNVVKADMDENWVALEMGHLLEDLVARIFAKKTGLHIFQRKVMFQHPLYPWMLADLDYLVELPDGSNAILEIKTTNYNARENWWYNGEEIVPVYYESQGRHYMSVMNLDRVYFCCLYGNNEDEVIIRHLDRDYAYESELIALEDAFWNEHVQKRQLPDYTESGDLILQSLQRWKGIDRRDLPPAAFGAPQVTQIHQYLQLQEEKNALAKQVTQLDSLPLPPAGAGSRGSHPEYCVRFSFEFSLPSKKIRKKITMIPRSRDPEHVHSSLRFLTPVPDAANRLSAGRR